MTREGEQKRKREQEEEIQNIKRPREVAEEEVEKQTEVAAEEEEVGESEMDMVDCRILHYLVEARNAENGTVLGVPVSFHTPTIWQAIAREVSLECNLDPPILDREVFNRAKAMRTILRQRTCTTHDEINRAFGPCDNCGNIAHFPNLFTPPSQNQTMQSSSSSQPSTSNPPRGINSDSPLADRVDRLIRMSAISVMEGLGVLSLAKNNDMSQLLLKLTDEDFIRAAKDTVFP